MEGILPRRTQLQHVLGTSGQEKLLQNSLQPMNEDSKEKESAMNTIVKLLQATQLTSPDVIKVKLTGGANAAAAADTRRSRRVSSARSVSSSSVAATARSAGRSQPCASRRYIACRTGRSGGATA